MHPHALPRPSLRPLGLPLAVWLSLALGCASAPPATQPRAISFASGKCAQPPYPAGARDTEAEGTTVLDFEVNPEGKVTRVAIVGTSGLTAGHKILDTAALDTLNKCSFAPAPGFLSARSRISYVWRLKD